jgi:hypothetical protein
MENWPALMGVAALALLSDRALVWMERRGWIYWRQGALDAPPRPSGRGTAALVEPREWVPPRDKERMLRQPRRARRRLGGRPRPRG